MSCRRSLVRSCRYPMVAHFPCRRICCPCCRDDGGAEGELHCSGESSHRIADYSCCRITPCAFAITCCKDVAGRNGGKTLPLINDMRQVFGRNFGELLFQ